MLHIQLAKGLGHSSSFMQMHWPPSQPRATPSGQPCRIPRSEWRWNRDLRSFPSSIGTFLLRGTSFPSGALLVLQLPARQTGPGKWTHRTCHRRNRSGLGRMRCRRIRHYSRTDRRHRRKSCRPVAYLGRRSRPRTRCPNDRGTTRHSPRGASSPRRRSGVRSRVHSRILCTRIDARVAARVRSDVGPAAIYSLAPADSVVRAEEVRRTVEVHLADEDIVRVVHGAAREQDDHQEKAHGPIIHRHRYPNTRT